MMMTVWQCRGSRHMGFRGILKTTKAIVETLALVVGGLIIAVAGFFTALFQVIILRKKD